MATMERWIGGVVLLMMSATGVARSYDHPMLGSFSISVSRMIG